MQNGYDSKAEAGLNLNYNHGRPDIGSILKHMQQDYNNLSEISVHAAGESVILRSSCM